VCEGGWWWWRGWEEMRMRNEIHTARRMSSPPVQYSSTQATFFSSPSHRDCRRHTTPLAFFYGLSLAKKDQKKKRQRQNARFPLRSSHVPPPGFRSGISFPWARAKKKKKAVHRGAFFYCSFPFHFHTRNLPAVPCFSFFWEQWRGTGRGGRARLL
jgi:hypothetical protein